MKSKIIWGLIIEFSSHYSRVPFVEFLTECNELTGIKAPKSLVDLAEEWDAEIEETAKVPGSKGRGKK